MNSRVLLVSTCLLFALTIVEDQRSEAKRYSDRWWQMQRIQENIDSLVKNPHRMDSDISETTIKFNISNEFFDHPDSGLMIWDSVLASVRYVKCAPCSILFTIDRGMVPLAIAWQDSGLWSSWFFPDSAIAMRRELEEKRISFAPEYKSMFQDRYGVTCSFVADGYLHRVFKVTCPIIGPLTANMIAEDTIITNLLGEAGFYSMEISNGRQFSKAYPIRRPE